MKTVILCGGLGTRIREVSQDLPKPMVPIGPHPIVFHIMQYYASADFNDFILCLGYKSEEIKNYFLNWQYYSQDFTLNFGEKTAVEFHGNPISGGWSITMADTGLHSLTGTRVKKIKDYIGDDENFFLTYGDGLSNVDLDKLLAFHKEHGKVLTVTGVVPPGRFGEMIFDKSTQQVKAFQEKPKNTEGLISGGFFVCNRKIFDYLPDENHMLEHQPMRDLVEAGEMMVHRHDDFWHPMDTPRDYEYFNELYESGDTPWIVT